MSSESVFIALNKINSHFYALSLVVYFNTLDESMETRTTKRSSLLPPPLMGRPVPGKMQDVATICSDIDSDAIASRDNMTNYFAGEEYWHWSDCRRIYSEPAASLLDSSRGSITSDGSGEESAIEDDVFGDCSDDEFGASSEKGKDVAMFAPVVVICNSNG